MEELILLENIDVVYAVLTVVDRIISKGNLNKSLILLNS
jgi:hypothetical protein